MPVLVIKGLSEPGLPIGIEGPGFITRQTGDDQEIFISRNTNFTIGRGRDADITVPEFPLASLHVRGCKDTSCCDLVPSEGDDATLSPGEEVTYGDVTIMASVSKRREITQVPNPRHRRRRRR